MGAFPSPVRSAGRSRRLSAHEHAEFVSLDIDEEVVSQTTPIRAHKGLLKELAEAVVIMTPLQSVVAITLPGSPERWIKAG